MRNEMWLLAVVSAAGLVGTQSAAANPFNAKVDASRTAACVATYMTLSEASLKIGPQARAEELQAETGRGMERLKPFIEAASRDVGETKFYHDSVAFRQDDHRMLMTTPAGKATTDIADRLWTDAKECDHQLDMWNASQLCFTESRWQTCSRTSTSAGS